MLIANKMESNGLPGKIVISEDTKKILETNEDYMKLLEFIPHLTVHLDSVDIDV